MGAADAGQKPVQGLNTVARAIPICHAIGLRLGGTSRSQDQQGQKSQENWEKTTAAHGVFVRPGT